uniref:CSON002761 protein n=1 Tax=Culicoides sonorensis TaxID=179676 RepID=A0A336MLH1_CULSO
MKFSIIFLLSTFFVTVIYCENYCDTGLRAPDNSTDPNDCCPAPLFLPLDIVKECRDTYMEMQLKKNDIPGPPRGCCIGDCILERMGFNPKSDGNIDFEGLRSSILDITKGDPLWSETVSKAIYACYTMAETRAQEFNTVYTSKPAFEGEKMCHPVSGRVLSCITNEKFINCPTSVWKGTDGCEKIKTFVQRCEAPTKQS